MSESQIKAITVFGLQGHKVTLKEVNCLQNDLSFQKAHLNLVYLDRDVRRTPYQMG